MATIVFDEVSKEYTVQGTTPIPDWKRKPKEKLKSLANLRLKQLVAQTLLKKKGK